MWIKYLRMINQGILIENPISPHGSLGRIPQIEDEGGLGAQYHFPSQPKHFPGSAPPPPIPALGPSPPSPLLHYPNRVTEPVSLPPTVTVRIARPIRQLKRIASVQLQLRYQIDTVAGVWVGVLAAQVVAEELLVGRVESTTGWERRRRRFRISHSWESYEEGSGEFVVFFIFLLANQQGTGSVLPKLSLCHSQSFVA